MGFITLDVKITVGANVFGGWMVIDDQDVTTTNGRGSVDVSDEFDEHSFQYWFSGEPGAELSYEIKRGAQNLVKGKSAISAGKRYGRGGGEFRV